MQIPPSWHGLLLHSSTRSIHHVKHRTDRFHNPVYHSAGHSVFTWVTATLIYNIDLTCKTLNRSISHFTLQSTTVEVPPCRHGLLLHSSTTSIQHVKHQTDLFHTPVSYSPSMLAGATAALIYNIILTCITSNRLISNSSFLHCRSLLAHMGYCYAYLQHRFNM